MNGRTNDPQPEPEVLAREQTSFAVERHNGGVTIVISDERMPFSFAAHQTKAQASDLARKLNEALANV